MAKTVAAMLRRRTAHSAKQPIAISPDIPSAAAVRKFERAISGLEAVVLLSMRRLLHSDEIAKALATLSGWVQAGNTIRRTYRFADFRAAFAFMTDVAAVAEELQHHPDWSNSCADVQVALTTHDAGGLTELDFALARRIAVAASRHGSA